MSASRLILALVLILTIMVRALRAEFPDQGVWGGTGSRTPDERLRCQGVHTVRDPAARARRTSE